MIGNTQIQLEGYGILTVEQGVSFPLNFNIQNLKKPDSTPSSYSKEIVIIGDKDANRLLGQLFDVNITNSSFDINKKVKCNVIQEGSNVFENANFQLLSVEKTGSELPNGESEIKYTARVKSDLMSFFTDIKNKDLTDLKIYSPDDFQILNKENVTDSWNNDYTDKYKFIQYWKSGNSFPLKTFKPATYALSLFEQIHTDNGWEYEFGEKLDVKFDKLLIPYTGGFEVDNEVKEKASVLTRDETVRQYDFGCRDGYYPNLSNVKFDTNFPRIQFSIEDKDNYNQWDLGIEEFTAEFDSDYTFVLSIDYEHFLENPETSAAELLSPSGNIGYVLSIGYDIQYTVIDNQGNTSVLRKPITNTYVNLEDNGEFIAQPGLNSINNDVVNVSFIVDLNNGNKVENIKLVEKYKNITDENIVLNWVTGTGGLQTPVIVDVCSKINVNEVNLKVKPDLQYDINTPIYLDQFIPKDIKQRDFIKSIIDMYKLMVDVDPTQSNKLIYTTRDKYYDDGEEKDWTKKLARNKKIKQEWLVNKQGKNRIYTYKEDDDARNKTYQSVIGDIYGEYDFDYLNDYNTGEDKTELIFSPTPIRYNENSNQYLSSITPDGEYNIRLLYDGGIKDDGFLFIQNDDGTYPTNPTNEYPLSLHFDDPIFPSFDLNFGVCEYYFYNQYNVTQNNLWNLFHRRSVNQLFKGKLVTAYFDLTATDILNFNFSDRIFINDTWYNVNKIIDYNANANSLTKVELVTVDDGLSVNVSRPIKPFNPGPSHPWVSNPSTGNEDAQVGKYEDNTISVGFVGEIYGEDNTVQTGSKGLIVGDGNSMSGSSMIIGNNNTDNGLDNKLIVGNNTEPNEEYSAFIDRLSVSDNLKIGSKVINENTFDSIGTTLYKARITQGGTNDPVLTEYINNTGVTITSGRPQVGVYLISVFPDLFDGSNYEVVFSEQVDEGVQVRTVITNTSGSDGSIQINTYDGGVLTDGLLKGGPSGSLNRYNVITIKKY